MGHEHIGTSVEKGAEVEAVGGESCVHVSLGSARD